MLNDPEIVRRRTLHGWAFRDLKPETVNRCKAYLADGNPDHLQGTGYEEAREGVLSRLSNKERRQHGIPVPKIEKPAAEELPCGHDADDPNHMHIGVNGIEPALVFVVLTDGQTFIDSEMPPELLVDYFQTAVDAMKRAIEHKKAGDN